MPAERAGFTVTMFLVDVSPSMGKIREVEVPDGANGESMTVEMTNLEYALQFVKLKVQEMIYHGRKTEQCGLILFGTDDTDNTVNEKNGGYEHVSEYIPILQPDVRTLAKISGIEPSETTGDAIDALIVGIETQQEYLERKPSWTRKIVLITDGESPIEIEDWEATVSKMNALKISLTVVGVDFDDDELPFHEQGKSDIKRTNESFYHTFTSKLERGVVGNAEFALQELARPEIKQVKSQPSVFVLRVGDVESRAEEAIEIYVKTYKYTAKASLPSIKRFARRVKGDDEDESRMQLDDDEDKVIWTQLARRTEYFIDRGDGEEDSEGDAEDERKGDALEKVEKEELVRGFKYGASYVPCPDDTFPKLPTLKGIEICGFFKAKHFKRWQEMGEVYYVFGDTDKAMQQVALSSLVKAMAKSEEKFAIARWVKKDGGEPKVGVMWPMTIEGQMDYLMWVQMPFADDIRNFPFGSLDKLVSKTNNTVTSHPYLPTKEQESAMDRFVDEMDLMNAGEKNEEGEREPWFDVRLSYNPALHRMKQALLHAAVVDDISKNPLPPPHPELTKYFDPPLRVLKRARDAIEECKDLFKVREVPAKVTRARKDGHVRARDEDEDMLLLDKTAKRPPTSSQMPTTQRAFASQHAGPSPKAKRKPEARSGDDSSATESETEPESDAEDLLVNKGKGAHLPTPTRSPEPDRGRASGRIIGNTYPLDDFRQNIARGDVVTKAVEDLGDIIKEVVAKPFASRRTEEMLQCMRVLRKVALEEDEIDAWNAFLRQLHEVCLESKPGNKEFWTHVQGEGRTISLISKSEASKFGGTSDVTDAYAAEFIHQQ
ncbi:hypothetical protein CERSUDRAFT_146244 [Gelatoporia subvermispora B]|uniref:ATP-dependent DNA helicase II subunit 2 n=1 Tax=Ceriporiopsis subvermispora (strain B) TaxID=914234 RepID=M2RSC9_CERS8|nr:hypothetical protein CERSUDRAFT_146244 [Gelatoporia subvermispora B]